MYLFGVSSFLHPHSFFGSSPGSCAYFTSYEVMKYALSHVPVLNSSPFIANFAAGLGAETISCVIWVPIDVVKERLQVQTAKPGTPGYYRGSFHALRTIARTEGLRGVYRGYGATGEFLIPDRLFVSMDVLDFRFRSLMCFFPWMISSRVLRAALCCVSVELRATQTRGGLVDRPRNDRRPLSASFRTVWWVGRVSWSFPPTPLQISRPSLTALCSPFLLSGVDRALASFVTNPLDMSKLRIQVTRSAEAQSTAENPRHVFPLGMRCLLFISLSVPSSPSAETPIDHSFNYRNIFHGVAQIARKEGFSGLWKGEAPTLE